MFRTQLSLLPSVEPFCAWCTFPPSLTKAAEPDPHWPEAWCCPGYVRGKGELQVAFFWASASPRVPPPKEKEEKKAQTRTQHRPVPLARVLFVANSGTAVARDGDCVSLFAQAIWRAMKLIKLTPCPVADSNVLLVMVLCQPYMLYASNMPCTSIIRLL